MLMDTNLQTHIIHQALEQDAHFWNADHVVDTRELFT